MLTGLPDIPFDRALAEPPDSAHFYCVAVVGTLIAKLAGKSKYFTTVAQSLWHVASGGCYESR